MQGSLYAYAYITLDRHQTRGWVSVIERSDGGWLGGERPSCETEPIPPPRLYRIAHNVGF